MSKIVINFDTVEKTLEVSVDGENQENISSVNIYSYNPDEAHIELTKIKSDAENDSYERTCLYASHKETFIEPIIDLDKLSKNLSIGLSRSR